MSQKPTPSLSTGIMRFAMKTYKCMACKTPMTGEEKTLCHSCQPREGEIYRKHLGKVLHSEGCSRCCWGQGLKVLHCCLCCLCRFRCLCRRRCCGCSVRVSLRFLFAGSSQ